LAWETLPGVLKTPASIAILVNEVRNTPHHHHTHEKVAAQGWFEGMK